MQYQYVLKSLFIKSFIIVGSLTLSMALTGCGEKMIFVSDCKLSGGNSELCDCAWEKVSQKYPPKLIQAITHHEAPAPQGYGQYLLQTIQYCAKQQSQ